MLTLPAGLLSSSMPFLLPSVSVRRRWPCLLFESTLYPPLRLVLEKPKCVMHVWVPIRWPFSTTRLALFETILQMAPLGLTDPRRRLMQVSPMAGFMWNDLFAGALSFTTTWKRAAPFALPGLTMFMTLVGGSENLRRLHSIWLLNVPDMLRVLTIMLFRCGLPGTNTLSPLLPRPVLLPTTPLQVDRWVPDPVRCFDGDTCIYLSLCLRAPWCPDLRPLLTVTCAAPRLS